MPALRNNSATILVSGGNGFIAKRIVGAFLEKGYNVRASVRTLDKGKDLQDLYKSYGTKLQLVEVGDIRAKGAFDEAVKGVEGIIHAASPVHNPDTMVDSDPKDLISPAVDGSTGIVNSALAHGDVLQRLVFISSCASIQVYSTGNVTVDENTWNEDPIRECEENGVKADPLSKYCAGKCLAEKAVWDIYNSNKANLKWDLTVVNPPWVFGVSGSTSYANAPPSTQLFYNAIVKGDFGAAGTASALTSPAHGFVHARDVADILVKILETPAAGGERIVLCAGDWVWQDFVDVAQKLDPSPYAKGILAKGEPDGARQRFIHFETAKEKRIIGHKFRTAEEIVQELLSEIASWNESK
ncbi:D-lactaldehyde dehydrogenase [Cylindrobasidium torrendii FP15055 ss-10]|uniref:D-lactaldehyde dehydrogenase n=1 Tax=Cylindrobasidium torrendii FP15055 ss-10 TaxID=1314674 RepID=A0A0D7B5R3_9AGAR|nr:D-lactaldehyde dehydrogenase [Cylindrobasidium torrendii FP15055 ss-10]